MSKPIDVLRCHLEKAIYSLNWHQKQLQEHKANVAKFEALVAEQQIEVDQVKATINALEALSGAVQMTKEQEE